MLTSESRPRSNFVSRPSNFSNKAPKPIATPTIVAKPAIPANNAGIKPEAPLPI